MDTGDKYSSLLYGDLTEDEIEEVNRFTKLTPIEMTKELRKEVLNDIKEYEDIISKNRDSLSKSDIQRYEKIIMRKVKIVQNCDKSIKKMEKDHEIMKRRRDEIE